MTEFALIAFKIFGTCCVIFGSCALIEDALKPRGSTSVTIKAFGGVAVIIGFISLFAAFISLIWGI